MTNEEVKEQALAHFPAVVFDETGEWLNMTIDKDNWMQLAKLFRYHMEFDYLFCMTCIDWKTHLTMVYHLSSTKHRHTVVCRCNLDRESPAIESVSDTWRTAEFHEREVFELFGVNFLGHPDLRRLILTDDFEGYPLRKDFEDPVNMIKL